MPWKLVRSGKGYKVVKKATGEAMSKKPMPKARAMAQMRALYANVKEGR